MVAVRSLVWQWGRYGGGPRYAFELAKALQAYTGLKTQLSMSKAAEILDLNNCRSSVDLPISTYSGNFGFIAKTLTINHWLGGSSRMCVRIAPTSRSTRCPDIGTSFWSVGFES